jgi:hypothetical protein
LETLLVSAFTCSAAKLSDSTAIRKPAFQKLISGRLLPLHKSAQLDFLREPSGQTIFLRNNCTIGTTASVLIFQRSPVSPKKN